MTHVSSELQRLLNVIVESILCVCVCVCVCVCEYSIKCCDLIILIIYVVIVTSKKYLTFINSGVQKVLQILITINQILYISISCI
jgi:hypothetical protein